jgi:hypothetical protein
VAESLVGVGAEQAERAGAQHEPAGVAQRSHPRLAEMRRLGEFLRPGVA